MWPHRQQPTRLPHPWDSPGNNTGVRCHFLLQCVKVKSLSRVRLLATPWTAAYQPPPSIGFSRQEYWSGVPLPSSCLDEGSVNCCLQDKSCSLPGFINEVSLAHSHAHCIMYSLWLLSHCSHRIVTETIWLAQPKIFTIWPFTEEVCWPLV